MNAYKHTLPGLQSPVSARFGRCQRSLAVRGSVMGVTTLDSGKDRGLGMPRCLHCGAVSHAGAKFCSQCGRGISEPAGAEPSATLGVERRQVTVLFCDLVGSTPLAKRIDADDYKDVIQAFSK